MELNLSLRKMYQILRKQKKIKLRDIAKEIGVSVPMLSMYENELVNLSKEKEDIYREIIRR
jgi:transcriptional regulator with XRE-family HTH domain